MLQSTIILIKNNIFFKCYLIFIGISLFFINVYYLLYFNKKYNIKQNIVKKNKIYTSDHIKNLDNEYYNYFKYINNFITNKNNKISYDYLNLMNNYDSDKILEITNNITKIINNPYYIKSIYLYKKISSKIEKKYKITNENCNKLIIYLILIK